MRKILSIVALMAIIVATIFVACSKRNEINNDDVNKIRKSKFYGKFSKTHNANTRSLGDGLNIEELSNQELLDFAKGSR